jgi:ABC-2 type transport system permease protein
MRVILTFAMSLFLLFVFSFVMKSSMTEMIKSPINYLISGIIIMTVFQTALNNSTSILEDISSGFMKEIIISPISRWQISVGQILSSSVIAIIQGILVLVMGLFFGLSVYFPTFLELIEIMAVVGATFSSMGLFLATVAKSSSTFQTMATVLVMPLTFLSGAYIPTTILPKFLMPIIYINPLTYVTSVFRYVTMKMWNVPTAQLIK